MQFFSVAMGVLEALDHFRSWALNLPHWVLLVIGLSLEMLMINRGLRAMSPDGGSEAKGNSEHSGFSIKPVDEDDFDEEEWLARYRELYGEPSLLVKLSVWLGFIPDL